MARLAVPLGLVALFLWWQFADIWWLGVCVIVGLTLLAAWQERRIDALYVELERLRNMERSPDREPLFEPAPTDSLWRRPPSLNDWRS